ncbi:MAG TPA: AI-2E family transporter [Solirubrobacteraceae bacterium]
MSSQEIGQDRTRPDPRNHVETGTAEPADDRPDGYAVYGAVLLGAILVIAGLLVGQLVSLLLAVMITIIISLPLSWCAEGLAPRGVSRPVGAFVGLLIGITAIAGLLALVLPPLISQAEMLITATPGLVHAVEIKLSHLTGVRPGHIAEQLQRDAGTFVRSPSRLLGPIASLGLSAATATAGLVISVITAYYVAARPEPLIDGLLSLFPADRRPATERSLHRIRTAWLGWLRGLAISMLLVGGLLYLALRFLVGLQYALVFAVLSGLCEVVPYLGALASGIPPVAFALTISPSTAIVVLVIYVVVHQIEANMIGPLIMSRAVHLHPAVIAFGVIAVGEIFGFLGLIVAVPILSLTTILVDELWVRPRNVR